LSEFALSQLCFITYAHVISIAYVDYVALASSTKTEQIAIATKDKNVYIKYSHAPPDLKHVRIAYTAIAMQKSVSVLKSVLYAHPLLQN